MMKKRVVIAYNPYLKQLARDLRNNSTRSEIFMWQMLKRKSLMGYDFHRQKPLGNYIVDFFCYELMLSIEIDGYSHSFSNVYSRDIEKEKWLNNKGITVLRFTDEDVFGNIDEVFRVLENYIKGFEEGNS